MSKYLQLLLHPSELRAISQWAIWHDPVFPRDLDKESDNQKRCYELLKLTSRSFAAVIEELSPELRVATMLFYLILRGLDTIEDDMTIPNPVKLPILRSFYEKLDQKGWTFNDSKEKDRVVLEEFDKIIDEFSLLADNYKLIIKDITKEMGHGMALYCEDEDFNKKGVDTIKDYNLYCHYVAGIVGEGLTRLGVAGNLIKPQIMQDPELWESMGLFLQKTNIIRDYYEDLCDNRRFWPKEIWSKYGNSLDDFAKPENEQAGLACLDEMVADALEHIPGLMFYLAGIKEQSMFNFCTIPQVMAIATLELVYKNKNVFSKNVKIRKGLACKLMLQASNIQATYGIFQEYCHKIQMRNSPRDSTYVRISMACAKVDQFTETVFPTKISAEELQQKEQATFVTYISLCVVGGLLAYFIIFV
ncbi:isoprenoid synthase domain-containing protein [Lipomyces oligophaga]|uniref:isoprenoid synthase domain-containing protein n=1 Tax=Lipomyces oligophaga TaxID=45792 RepID=UPI0034CE6F86